MAVVIRLKRMGSNQKAVYRLIVVDDRFSGKGRRVEDLGTYNPRDPKNSIPNLNWKALEEWRKKGAKLSETVERLIRKNKTLQKNEVTI